MNTLKYSVVIIKRVFTAFRSMKNPAEPPEGGGGQIEKRLTWALNLAAFLHIIVSPYTKVNPLNPSI